MCIGTTHRSACSAVQQRLSSLRQVKCSPTRRTLMHTCTTLRTLPHTHCIKRSSCTAMSGDVYLFSGANAHTVLCVGERPSLAAYESFVNLNVRYVQAPCCVRCERTHVYLRSVSCAPLSLASAAGARAVQESPCARVCMLVCPCVCGRMRVCTCVCTCVCARMRVCPDTGKCVCGAYAVDCTCVSHGRSVPQYLHGSEGGSRAVLQHVARTSARSSASIQQSS